MTDPLNARTWLSADPDFHFPETKTDLANRTAPVGLCFSGGGTRALSAGMGQLRALHAMGLLDRARYLSCVSGGSWLSTAFTYYATGADNDGEFLGAVTAPASINMDTLTAPIAKSCVGWTATNQLMPTFRRHATSALPKPQVWVETVGEMYFQPWGLHDGAHPRAFTLDAASRDDILRRNPSLQADDFHLARPNRPYLIVNGAVVGVPGLHPLEELNPSPLEMTPLYGGSPYGWEVLFRGKDRRWESHWIGGGFTETFALGSTYPYRLCDASGTSSAFLAGFTQNVPGALSEGNPVLDMRPVTDPQAPARTFYMGDGGVVDNYGLLALMRRKVPRAIVFINTSDPLNLAYDARTQTPKSSDIDAYLPPLFGFPVAQTGVQTGANRVFRPRDLAPIVETLQAAKRAGGPLVARTKLEVQANVWWGIEGGWTMDVMWVYLDRSSSFEASIGDERVRKELDRRSHPLRPRQGKFAKFPNYSTSFHNGPDMVMLTPEQVKLLADHTCWTVISSQALIAPMFAGE